MSSIYVIYNPSILFHKLSAHNQYNLNKLGDETKLFTETITILNAYVSTL